MARKRETYTRELAVILTTEEMRDLAGSIVEGQELLTAAEEKKKDVGSQLTADVNAAKAKVQSLTRKYRNGYEYRPVECYEKEDPEERTLTVYRSDTGEVVEVRKLPPQMKLPGTSGAGLSV
jgi:hypothetical protein